MELSTWVLVLSLWISEADHHKEVVPGIASAALCKIKGAKYLQNMEKTLENENTGTDVYYSFVCYPTKEGET